MTALDWFRIAVACVNLGALIAIFCANRCLKRENDILFQHNIELTRHLANEIHKTNVLSAALKRVLLSEVVKTANFSGYSEAISDARDLLGMDREVLK
jgi:hypothetical protein